MATNENAMVVDREGYSHICYQNYGEGLIKYAKGHEFNAVHEQKKLRELAFEVYPTIMRQRLNIQYVLDRKAVVDISICNILGQKIVDLINEEKESGKYVSCWVPGKITNGMYFCRLKSKRCVITKKFIILGGVR